MSTYKKVDADQLDADLTSVADAIRERAGTAEKLNFPDGFVSAVGVIIDKVIRKELTHIYSEISVVGINSALSSYTKLESISMPNIKQSYAYLLDGCTSLKDVNFPSLEKASTSTFKGCTSLTKLDLPKLNTIAASAFHQCANLTTLVFRNNKVVTLENINAFSGTPFASGGTGGTVYCPSAQIENYKKATNWTTLYSAGTCNFVAIEGSEYE